MTKVSKGTLVFLEYFAELLLQEIDYIINFIYVYMHEYTYF